MPLWHMLGGRIIGTASVEWQCPRCYRISMGTSIGPKIAARLAFALGVFAVPLFLVTATVTWAVNDLRLYKYGFDKYDVALVTGIEREGLVAAARQIRGYFNSPGQPLKIRATAFGEERELFNDREVVHMADVKRLIWGVYGVGAGAVAYLLGLAGVGFFLRRRAFAPVLSRCLLWGSGLTLVLVVVVGLIAVVGFDSLFLFFHRVSFSNDFWMLDPRRDYLVMMFPNGFWFDATLFVALATVVEALVFGGATGGFLAFRRHRVRRRQEPLLERP